MRVQVLGIYNYWVFAVLLMLGLYAVIARGNYVKKLLGLSLFQAAVFLLYISIGKVAGGKAPILGPDHGETSVYSNPLPQVLILTAIVVGIATQAVGLALLVRIKRAYGTVEEDLLTEIARSGVERSDVERSGAEHGGAEHSGAEHRA